MSASDIPIKTRNSRKPKTYRIEVRGVVPKELWNRISELHAHAIQQVSQSKDERATGEKPNDKCAG